MTQELYSCNSFKKLLRYYFVWITETNGVDIFDVDNFKKMF